MPIHSPHVRSLNLSTCVGIALYEVLRQRSGLAREPPLTLALSPPLRGEGTGFSLETRTAALGTLSPLSPRVSRRGEG